MTMKLALTALLLAASGEQASAQWRNLTLPYHGLHLTDADRAMAASIAAGLYEKPGGETVAEQAWTTEAGVPVTTRVAASPGEDRPCADIVHEFRQEGRDKPARFLSRRCRGEDGVWRLAP